MNDSFEFTLHSPLTKEDWNKISDAEHEKTMSVIFQTPQGKQVKYIKCEVLDKIRAEIDEQYDKVHPYNLSCAEGLEIALEIIDKYNAESDKKEEISKDDAIKIVHDTIHDFFVDSETFNDKEKFLIKINKAICNNIMGY